MTFNLMIKKTKLSKSQHFVLIPIIIPWYKPLLYCEYLIIKSTKNLKLKSQNIIICLPYSENDSVQISVY